MIDTLMVSHRFRPLAVRLLLYKCIQAFFTMLSHTPFSTRFALHHPSPWIVYRHASLSVEAYSSSVVFNFVGSLTLTFVLFRWFLTPEAQLDLLRVRDRP